MKMCPPPSEPTMDYRALVLGPEKFNESLAALTDAGWDVIPETFQVNVFDSSIFLSVLLEREKDA